jgi:protein SMG6
MTAQGSVLETITFRSEEVKAQGTTDELILGCCLHYCRDSAREFMPNSRSEAIHLYREVVLLTEDRHLRMKAHTRNVPVKDVVKFARWSELIEDNSHHHQHNRRMKSAQANRGNKRDGGRRRQTGSDR